MPIDPSIPLGAQAPQFDISKLADLAQFGMQQKKQNALKAILADQENIDPTTGLPNTNAIRKIMGVDPTTGIKLLETDATLRQEQTKGKMDQMKIYQPLLKDAKDTLSNLLEPRIKEFGIDKAVEMTRGEYAETLKGLKAAGMPADVFGSIPPELTPAVANTLMAQAISPEKKADLAQKDRTDVRLEAAEKEREKHDRETERLMADRLDAGKDAATKKGWVELQDDKGVTYRENVGAGLTQKKVDGKWEDIDQLPANVHKLGATQAKGWQMYQTEDGKLVRINPNAGKPQEMGPDGEWKDVDAVPPGLRKFGAPVPAKFSGKAGELMAALAERGVALPTGFRSKEQQVSLYDSLLERNPGLSADEIADKLKKGQIEFGAQKKETQTAAGVVGRVAVAANEIEEFAPLVRQASKLVDRGKFVPINKLMQMGEESISDPNLKSLRSYIQSSLNAYDMLAARGGTDKDKRAENHKLLTSAESPEALEAGLVAFEKEAQAAHRAAVKATAVPELQGPKAEAKTDTSDHSKKTDDELLKGLGLK